MRKRLYEIVEVAEKEDKMSMTYDMFMMIFIAISLVPIGFKETPSVILFIDRIIAVIFTIDYICRWITADFRLKKGVWSFFLYPFTLLAILDLLTIIPSFIIVRTTTTVYHELKLLKLIRLLRTLRVLRVFKAFRYSKSIGIIVRVFNNKKDSLLTVVGFAFGYILVSALLIYSVEPDTFKTFFDAIYWATISLTTVGYGDVYAISLLGKIITMVSSILGIAIVALPASIITAGYMEIIEDEKSRNEIEE